MKKLNESGHGRGVLEIILTGPDGKVKLHTFCRNTQTAAGKAGLVAQAMGTPDLNKPAYMAVGTGSGGTTALNAEISGSRTAIGTVLLSSAAVGSVVSDGTNDATRRATCRRVTSKSAAFMPKWTRSEG